MLVWVVSDITLLYEREPIDGKEWSGVITFNQLLSSAPDDILSIQPF